MRPVLRPLLLPPPECARVCGRRGLRPAAQNKHLLPLVRRRLARPRTAWLLPLLYYLPLPLRVLLQWWGVLVLLLLGRCAMLRR